MGRRRSRRATMSSIQTGRAKPTERRLDYREMAARHLVIVIDGPATVPPDAHWSQNGSPSHPTPASPFLREAEAIRHTAGYVPALFTPLLLAAWRGQEALALTLTAAIVEEEADEDGDKTTLLTEHAKAVLYNGLGRYQEALDAAQRACAHERLGLCGWARLELVEAGARAGARAIAAHALRQLEEGTRAEVSDYALGVWARSAALLSDGADAECLYQEALDLLGRTQMTAQLGRAQLVYGEWLRRQNRRVDARVQLRAAHDTFSDLAAEAFAERALRELVATGETARKRTDETRAYLTPQEAEIARLARDGLSNAEIGARLFISPRTVQYHLRKVFQKLGITSRNQLGRVPPNRLGMAELAAD